MKPGNKIEPKIEEYFGLSILITLVTAFSTIILIFLVTRDFIFDDFYFDKSTGEIGDTIGGIGNIVVGIITAILMYFTIRIQILTNQATFNKIYAQDEKSQSLYQFNALNNKLDNIKHGLWSIDILINESSIPIHINDLEAIEYFISKPKQPEFTTFLTRYTIILDNYLSFLKSLKIVENFNFELIDLDFLSSETKNIYIYYIKDQSTKMPIEHKNGDMLKRYFKLYESISKEITTLKINKQLVIK